MRTLSGAPPKPEPSEASPKIATVDWRVPPHAVLDAIDELLANYGLEVVIHDTDSDEYAFTVQRR